MTHRPEAMLRTVAVTLVAAGVISVVILSNAFFAMSGPQKVDAGELSTYQFNALLLMILGSIAVCNIAAGVQLLRRRAIGYRLALFALAPQLIALEFSGLQYQNAPLGFFGLYVGNKANALQAGLSFSTSLVIYLQTESRQGWSIEINVVVLAVFLFFLLRGRTAHRPKIG
jgi:hypothetical protein